MRFSEEWIPYSVVIKTLEAMGFQRRGHHRELGDSTIHLFVYEVEDLLIRVSLEVKKGLVRRDDFRDILKGLFS